MRFGSLDPGSGRAGPDVRNATRALHPLDLAWGAFVAAMLGTMLMVPSGQTIPYHMIFVTLTLLYGFRLWPPNVIASALIGVTVATGLVFLQCWARWPWWRLARDSARPTPGRRAARVPGSLPARRLLVGEALVLLAVLLGAGLLGSLGPPAAPRYAATPGWRPDTAPRVAQVDDLLVAISATPNRPGENFLTVDVHSTRRPAPAPVSAVLVQVDTDTPVPAAAQGGGSWLTPARGIRSPGPVTITVRVAREQLPDVVATQTWVVAPVPGTFAGGRPLRDLTRWAVLTLTIVGALIGSAAALRGRGPAPLRSPPEPAGPRPPSTTEAPGEEAAAPDVLTPA